jgi:hypothetical protein
MSATAEAAPARHLGAAEIVVDFDAERVKAPFFLRCGALLIDYIVLISIPVAGLLLTRYMGSGGPGLLGGSVNDAAWLVAVMIGLLHDLLTGTIVIFADRRIR